MISWLRLLVVSVVEVVEVVEVVGLVSLRTVAAAQPPLSRPVYRQLRGGARRHGVPHTPVIPVRVLVLVGLALRVRS
jgi:hypothetical protein